MIDYSELSDIQLAHLLAEGDRLAYTEIYDRYIFVLLNHAYNKTRNREEAKDVVHEVFTMLWSKRAELNLNINLSGFLYTSVRNIILNQFAHQSVQSRYIESVQHFANNEEPITDHLIREKQLSVLIDREISSLSPKMREVFELSRRDHLSHKEISEKLDISEQTVSKHVTNALRILRVRLGTFIHMAIIIYLQ